MLKQFWLRIVFLLGMAIALPGCVNVATTIHTNGAISKEVRVQVESSHEALAWHEIKQNLVRPDQAWTLKKSRRGQNTLIFASQLLPDANLAQDTSVHVERTNWITRRYEYRERLPLGQYAASQSAKAVATAIPVTVSLRMPGEILDAPGATLSANVATWNCTLADEEIVFQATSSQNRYCTAFWTLIVALLALAGATAWIKEKFSR